MTFRFTETDFERYVKMEEHGGRHIWHDLEDQLETLFSVAFANAPYIARGDRLRTLWFAPKETPRSSWSNQAQFFLIRDIDQKRLTFGLMVECASLSETAQHGFDPNRDGERLIEQLERNPDFSGQLDQLVLQTGWAIEVYEWGKEWHTPHNSTELLELLKRMPSEQGWGVHVQQERTAEEAVAAGEDIVAQIMDAYKATRLLWEAVIPEADREFLRTGKRPASPPQIVEPQPMLHAKTDICLALSRFFSAKGFTFTRWQIATFYAALKTKGFVILSGLSGTGKTRLAQYFAELMPEPEVQLADEPASQKRPNYHFAAVRPDWRDAKPLLGYYNPLTETYEFTALLRFILQADGDYRAHQSGAKPHFIILDEMNLARVEYYFADFLSVLESGRSEDGYTREALRFQYPPETEGETPPRQLRLPPNLYVVGTVNVDETTHAFSSKVLDRAFTIEMTEVDLDLSTPVWQ
jgi:energy-coupling factor transporter ATP-binding protein EcfA2